MYKHNLKQLELPDFVLPFQGELSRVNKWVKMAALIPWEEFEERYKQNFAKTTGAGHPALSVRMALAALIIKEELGASDRACVEQITENPYLQYFCGLKAFITDPPFDASMFVHFRKRFPAEVLSEVNNAIAAKMRERQDPPDAPQPPKGNQKADTTSQSPPNNGQLMVDATCTPADITFPTDIKLLNKAREKSEQVIDILHCVRGKGHKKPRTYRQRARKQFLSVAKDKRMSRQKIRKCLRRQLGYLRRNLRAIDSLAKYTGLSVLSPCRYKELLVISEVFRQQQWMYESRSRRIDNRIVSISQPHVRPIKRGKAAADTEFGAKVSISLVDGVSFVDTISWDNFNEGGELITQIETYRERFGCYPESVHADKIYRNRDNRRYCKKKGIRLSGPRLGRPPKVTESNAQSLKAAEQQARQDEIDRNAVEGKFGQGKRRYSLNRIMTKLSCTSETAIMISFLVMNLNRWLATIFFSFFQRTRVLFSILLSIVQRYLSPSCRFATQ